MYSKDRSNYDIGRIDVFIREMNEKNKSELYFKNIKIDGFKSKSRFGSTIAKLGDINNDGTE